MHGVTSGESVRPLIPLFFPILLCLTCLFNLEFVRRRVLRFVCLEGALTPLLPSLGTALEFCFSLTLCPNSHKQWYGPIGAAGRSVAQGP